MMRRYIIVKENRWYKVKTLIDAVEIFNLMLEGMKVYTDLKQVQNICDIENMGID